MITMNKKYRTRSGLPARVLATDVKDSVYPIVALVGGDFEEVERYTADGFFYEHRQLHELDLVEVLPYDDFKVDDPVFVRNNDCDTWLPRHFAGVNAQGDPLAFYGGETSFTSKRKPFKWDVCVKASDMEGEKK